MASQHSAFEFKRVLPRVVVAYEAGQLVPFIGAGMSRPHCAKWSDLIQRLENAADTSDGAQAITDDTKSEELIRRANRAVRKLRSEAPGRFEDALREALFDRKENVPENTRALASIWWPLVLTTNYDDFYVKAFADQFDAHGLAVVGRGSEDCQRVLTSLSTAGRSLLWALQGHIAFPSEVVGHQDDGRLARELVIDHAEYRRVTHREPHFRRAFGEVFRHRSFLFLGSGLRETYLQELFGEVLELYGPSTHTHFAIMPRGEIDPAFMYARFQIAVVEYTPGDHETVPAALAELHKGIEASQVTQISWGWRCAHARDQIVPPSHVQLEVVRGPLPMLSESDEPPANECLVISAGGELAGPDFFVSGAIRPTRNSWCKSPEPVPRQLSKFVAKYEGAPAFAVRARREDEDVKDLLQVRPASRALFDEAAPQFGCMRMQLLASGGKGLEEDGQPSYSVRTFPARFAFVEMVRAWGEWLRANPCSRSRLLLHVIDPYVYREIQSGRIDVLELLRCEDVRFWAEIVERGELVERRQFHRTEEEPLHQIVEELGLSEAIWTFDVSPITGIDQPGPKLLSAKAPASGQDYASCSLRELGVVPGSTLHFRRELQA